MPIESHRKLAAILSADAVGYSRLMQADEPATVETLNAYRAAMRRIIERHKGRVVNAPGDALLAEFASVVEAVSAAVEIQQALEGRNMELPAERRMHFRIGVNLGDVIEQEDGTIYGDGVNIAARMEALAEGGGVCVSSTVFDSVEGKLALGFDFLGEQQVKNITKPVRVYRVRTERREEKPPPKSGAPRKWLWPAVAGMVLLGALGGAGLWTFRHAFRVTPEDPAVALAKGPSIAVLPFTNLSGDPSQDYFADGITETLITDLSKLRNLKVIARNSTFTYKGKPIDVRQISRELGVRYVLEGSVQRAAGRIRMNVQLVDATTGNHLWAERFDRDLKDLFALQDEVTRQIVTELDVKLVAGEDARIWHKTLTNPKAYDAYLRGHEQRFIMSPESNRQARAFHEQAISLDPGFAMAYSGLAWAHSNDANFYWSDSRERSTQKALEAANQALQLDPNLPDAYSVLGMIHLFLLADHDKAVAFGKRAVELQPNGAQASAVLGILLTRAGDPEAARRSLEKAAALNPFPEPWYDFELGVANQLTGRLDKAIAHYESAIQKTPKWILVRLHAADAYVEAGRLQDARREIEAALQFEPGTSIEKANQFEPWKLPEVRDRYLANLRKAGLK
jgi:adenylate cyclase